MLNKLTIGFFILLASLLTGCGEPTPPASSPEAATEAESGMEEMHDNEEAETMEETEEHDDSDMPEEQEIENSEDDDY
ncbi:hypothetical protein ACQKPX_12400 [Photobacterium sp. DNB23_23_1]|uniref:Secreted protein n=1 Tax=Photobacterium pectinilyticum TaxID=2906793 RepID=A0ABT1MYA4_9GAMM|nr:hypothetical protein [Photobacterium sp. ZSDE20]MCQ1057463.1 hypothetical protein [Photobacterium sp. ZSDE20]MDD1821588.1 hypothetical protein [Photobacterium sp. ZSDE20]